MAQEQSPIDIAFDLLLEELKAEIERTNEAGAQAFAVGNYEQVDARKAQAKRLTTIQSQLLSVQEEWRHLSQEYKSQLKVHASQTTRQTLSRLPKGVRTPEAAFRLPILRALVALGGSAPMSQVLDKVEQEMKDQLQNIDYQPLPSNPRIIRWRNAAQWQRRKMVEEGLLRSDSKRGIWEISEAGRHWLAIQERDSGFVSSSSKQFSFPSKVKPKALILFGKRHRIRTWKELLLTVCRVLAHRHSNDFAEKAATIKGRSRQYIVSTREELTVPAQIPGTDLWVETNLSAKAILRLVDKLLTTFGYDTSAPDVFYVFTT